MIVRAKNLQGNIAEVENKVNSKEQGYNSEILQITDETTVEYCIVVSKPYSIWNRIYNKWRKHKEKLWRWFGVTRIRAMKKGWKVVGKLYWREGKVET